MIRFYRLWQLHLLLLGAALLWSAATAASSVPKVLVLGDSLSAAYGIALERGWVTQLEERIRSHELPHEVVNASVSGETTRGGLERLPDLLDRHRPELVLIELGGNDGLRGQSLQVLADNLTAMVSMAQQAGAEVALFEMMIPLNYGAAYAQRFSATFEQVATETEATLVPFFLASIAEDPDAFLDDGIHPSAAAQPVLLEAVWPHVSPLLHASKPAASRN